MKEILIDKTEISPYRKICHLTTRRRLRAHFSSTGFFIHPRVILTAGHNLYSNAVNHVNHIWITPGQFDDYEPYGTIELGKDECRNSIRVHPEYDFSHKANVRRQVDLAMIILAVGATDGFKNWQPAADFTIDRNLNVAAGDMMYLAGYPAAGPYDGTKMYQDSEALQGIDRKFLQYEMFAAGGNSGSPVWKEEGGARKVAGVHTFDGGATYLTGDNMQWLLKNIGSL